MIENIVIEDENHFLHVPNLEMPNAKQKMLESLDEHIRILVSEREKLDKKSEEDLKTSDLVRCFDLSKVGIPRSYILGEVKSKYVHNMEVSLLRKLRFLFTKLEIFISQPKLGNQTDLHVELFDDEASTFVSAMKNSPFNHYEYVATLRRSPYSEVTCHHFETDDYFVVSELIESLGGLDSDRILFCYSFVNSERGERKIVHKDFIDMIGPLETLRTVEDFGWSIYSPFTIKLTRVMFGEYTTPGFDPETKGWNFNVKNMISKKINHEGKQIILERKDSNHENQPPSIIDIIKDNNNKRIKAENNEDKPPSDPKKRKRKTIGRFKILYYKGIYEDDGIGWLALKCKFGKSNNGIFQWKDC